MSSMLGLVLGLGLLQAIRIIWRTLLTESIAEVCTRGIILDLALLTPEKALVNLLEPHHALPT